jgi:hypothetical protein
MHLVNALWLPALRIQKNCSIHGKEKGPALRRPQTTSLARFWQGNRLKAPG